MLRSTEVFLDGDVRDFTISSVVIVIPRSVLRVDMEGDEGDPGGRNVIW